MSQSGPPSRTTGAVRAARSGYDRAVDLLERLVPIASRLQRVVRAYGIAVAVAAVVIVGTVLAVDLPGTVWTWALAVALLIALLIAPVVILVFASMLHEAVSLPGQLRNLPDMAPTRARELASLAREAKVQHREQAGSIPRDSWRAARLLNALRKEIPTASVLISMARVPFMILVAAALLVGLAELVFAPILVVVALISAVI